MEELLLRKKKIAYKKYCVNRGWSVFIYVLDTNGVIYKRRRDGKT